MSSSNTLGSAQRYFAQENWAKTEQSCRLIIQKTPDDISALNLLAKSLLKQGKLQQSIEIYQQLLKLEPHNATIEMQLGYAYQLNHQFQQAIECYEKLANNSTKNSKIYNNLGLCYAKLDKKSQAISAFKSAIHINNDDPDPHNNLSLIYKSQAQYQLALKHLKVALSKNSQNIACLNNIVNIYKNTGDFVKAEQYIKKILAIDKNHVLALDNLGQLKIFQGQYQAAENIYNQIIQQGKDTPRHHYQLSHGLLAKGDFPKAWEEHEWRKRCSEFSYVNKAYPQPLWQGEPLEDKTLLLYDEQGYGDAILFYRFIKKLTAKKIIFQCQPALVTLFQMTGGVDVIIGNDLPLSASFDYHLPLMSIPHVLQLTRTKDIFSYGKYLNVDSALIAHWQQKMSHDNFFKIGVIWSVSKVYDFQFKHRSYPVELLLPLSKIKHVKLYSLQVGPQSADLQKLQDKTIIDLSKDIQDFADTAAIMENCDLIISTDTATANLAGSLGKEIWLVLNIFSEWRWQGDHHPWYPYIRYFQQDKLDDWQPVFEKITAALIKKVSCRQEKNHHASVTAETIIASTLQSAYDALENNHFDQAKDYCQQCLTHDAKNSQALGLLGIIFYQQQQFQLAEQYCQQAFCYEPQNPQYAEYLGITLQAQGKTAQAINAYQIALTLAPENPMLHFNLGYSRQSIGQYQQAIEHYQDSININKNFFASYNNLGLCYAALSQYPMALITYEKALQLHDNDIDLNNNLAITLRELKQYDRAIAVLKKILTQDENNRIAMIALGNCYTHLENYPLALEILGIALKIDHTNSNAHYAIAKTYRYMGELSQAKHHLQRVLALDNNNINALDHLGQIEMFLDNYQNSEKMYQTLFSHANSTTVSMYYHYSLSLLRAGQLPRAWDLYEWRKKLPELIKQHQRYPYPQWRGEDLKNKHILFYTEQGYGDALQFFRFLKKIHAGKIVLQCSRALVRLFSHSPWVDVVLSRDEKIETLDFSIDYQCALLSIPYILQLYQQNDIYHYGRYLSVSETLIKSWSKKIHTVDHFNIGVIWSVSNKIAYGFKHRSYPLSQLKSLTQLSNVSLYSLQINPSQQEQQQLAQLGIINITDGITDFADTAAIMAHMDLVICPDTGTAHLAGALGKETWLVLNIFSEWRWSKNNPPWYSAIKYFQQEKLDQWTVVFKKITDAINSKLTLN